MFTGFACVAVCAHPAWVTFAFITRCGWFTGGLGGAVGEVATVVSVMSEIEMANVRILVVKTLKIRILDLNYANGVFEFDGYRLCVFLKEQEGVLNMLKGLSHSLFCFLSTDKLSIALM